jgi:hypothetical protein
MRLKEYQLDQIANSLAEPERGAVMRSLPNRDLRAGAETGMTITRCVRSR